jgi:hypothetical protein
MWRYQVTNFRTNGSQLRCDLANGTMFLSQQPVSVKFKWPIFDRVKRTYSGEANGYPGR